MRSRPGELNFSEAQDEIRVIMRARKHEAPGKEDSLSIGTEFSFLIAMTGSMPVAIAVGFGLFFGCYPANRRYE